MDNVLKKLKAILNGLTEKELNEFDLWIDNKSNIDIIAVDENAITLITDSSKLKIDEKRW